MCDGVYLRLQDQQRAGNKNAMERYLTFLRALLEKNANAN